MVPRLLVRLSRALAPRFLDAERSFGCERGRSDGHAGPLLLRKEEIIDDWLKGRRRDELHGMQRQLE